MQLPTPLNLITILYHPIRSVRDYAGTSEHVLLNKHYSNILLSTHFKMADSHTTTARAPGSGLLSWLACTLLARPALANMPAVPVAPCSAAYRAEMDQLMTILVSSQQRLSSSIEVD